MLKSAEPDRPNDLEPPGGRVNWGEQITNTLKRELQEELGLSLDKVKHEIKLYAVNQRDAKEYGWEDGKTTILELYYLITIPPEAELNIYAKDESEGLVYVDRNFNLDDYTYTAKGRREIYKSAQKSLHESRKP